MTYLVYQTKTEADQALLHLETKSYQLLSFAGRKFDVNGSLVSKDHKGQPSDKTKTVSWDSVKYKSGTGYYFKSPKYKFPDYYTQLVTGNYTEKETI